jgi:hypothetical protein
MVPSQGMKLPTATYPQRSHMRMSMPSLGLQSFCRPRQTSGSFQHTERIVYHIVRNMLPGNRWIEQCLLTSLVRLPGSISVLLFPVALISLPHQLHLALWVPLVVG